MNLNQQKMDCSIYMLKIPWSTVVYDIGIILSVGFIFILNFLISQSLHSTEEKTLPDTCFLKLMNTQKLLKIDRCHAKLHLCLSNKIKSTSVIKEKHHDTNVMWWWCRYWTLLIHRWNDIKAAEIEVYIIY